MNIFPKPGYSSIFNNNDNYNDGDNDDDDDDGDGGGGGGDAGDDYVIDYDY